MHLLLLSIDGFGENWCWKGLVFLGNKRKHIYKYKTEAFKIVGTKYTFVKSAYCMMRHAIWGLIGFVFRNSCKEKSDNK
jgi:hypothetical protein